MSAYGLFVHLALLVLFAIIQAAIYASIVLVCLIIILINVDPYKKSMACLTRSDAAFMILLTLFYVGVNSVTIEHITSNHHKINIGLIVCGVTVITTTVFSICYVMVLACYWIVHQRKQQM